MITKEKIDRINALAHKAKTAEGMGPIGEGKAISAIASVLIE